MRLVGATGLDRNNSSSASTTLVKLPVSERHHDVAEGLLHDLAQPAAEGIGLIDDTGLVHDVAA